MHDLQSTHACRHHHAGFAASASDKYPPDRGLEPIDLEIDLHVDVAGRRAAGAVTHRVVARRAGAQKLRLDAVGLAGIAVDGLGEAIAWSAGEGAIEVTWTRPFALGEERRVKIAYHVDDPTTGILFSAPSEALPDAPWFAAVDNETERARHWMPCVDHPSVRPTLSFTLRAEARFTILANGVCVGEEAHDDGTKTSRWRLEVGCPSYLTCFAIGEFVRVDDGEVLGVPVAYFATTDHSAEDLRRSFGRTPAMLRWLAERVGVPFPFPKYFQFAVPGIGGAMENISLVSWDDVFVADASLFRELGQLIDQINIHEMAHSYFGDLVVIRDFCDAWLKESWATYIESCWLEHAEGDDALRFNLWESLQRYIREADHRYKRPIVTRRFEISWDLFDAHLYPGGAVRLHMLRRELGDEVFWPAITDYIKAHAGGLAETDDLRRCLERRSGRSLARFFDQWIRSPGYPKVRASFRRDAAAGEGIVEIEQTQVDAKAGVPCFEFPLVIEWTIDGVSARREVQVERAKHTFAMPMAGEPTAIRLDPDARMVWALDFNPGEERLRRQLREAADVTGRILAARELIKAGGREGLAAITAAWAEEPFWGVRAAWAEALGEAQSAGALAVLLAVIDGEEEPRVIERLLRALSHYRDPGVVKAIAARVERGLDHRALQAAYEALGAQRRALPAEWVDRLVAACRAPSFGGHATAGALRGLASSRAERAMDVLEDSLHPGAACGEKARPSAVAALGGLARVLDRGGRERAIEALVDRLRDPSPRVREAAVTGLRVAEASVAAEAIEAYARPLAAQFRIPHMRTVDGLRRGASPKVAALEKEVGELQDRLRKLEDEVNKLRDRAKGAAKDAGGDGEAKGDAEGDAKAQTDAKAQADAREGGDAGTPGGAEG